MSLDCGRKPKHPEKTHTGKGRTCKVRTERPCTTVPTHFKPYATKFHRRADVPHKGNSKTTSILCFPERLWHWKKLERLQWKHKCSSVLATVGVEGKQHFVEDICIKFAWLLGCYAIWVNSHTSSPSFFGVFFFWHFKHVTLNFSKHYIKVFDH